MNLHLIGSLAAARRIASLAVSSGTPAISNITLSGLTTAPGGVASISGSQTYTKSVLQSTDAVDNDYVVTDNETVFPILGDAAVAKIYDGLNKFNASTPQINKGFKFDSDNALLAVTSYKVTAAGDAEIRTTLDMLASADADLTRIVNNGELQPGFTLGGIASFTKPGETQPTEPPTEAPETYLLGDADNNGTVDDFDVATIQRYCAKKYGYIVSIEITRRNGDVDRNGELDIIDATFIQRKLVKQKLPYPIGKYVPVE